MSLRPQQSNVTSLRPGHGRNDVSVVFHKEGRCWAEVSFDKETAAFTAPTIRRRSTTIPRHRHVSVVIVEHYPDSYIGQIECKRSVRHGRCAVAVMIDHSVIRKRVTKITDTGPDM